MLSYYSKKGYHAINQDACGYLEQDNLIIMAVADGHGHYLHFRADVGARLAVDAAIDCFKDIHCEKEELESLLSMREKKVPMVWKEKVLAYHENHVVDALEWAYTREYAQAYIDQQIPIEFAYGSTLLVAVYFKEWNRLYVSRVGDGEILKLNTFFMYDLVEKNDYGSEFVTESICEKNAQMKNNIEYATFDKGLTKKDTLILSTDGLSKFSNMSEIVKKIRKDPNKLEEIIESLDNVDDLTMIVYRK